MTRAIVILYQGDEPTESFKHILKSAIEKSNFNAVGQIDVTYVDANRIAEHIVIPEHTDENPLNNAAIFIGKLFFNDLQTGDVSVFTNHLMRNLYHNNDPELRTAMEIISKERGMISGEICEKYKITSHVITSIQNIYKSILI